MKTIAVACAAVSVLAVEFGAQSGPTPPPASLSTQPSMNVFRRFAPDAGAMVAFYGDVLALKPAPTINMPGGGRMIQFSVGTALIKLQATPAAGDYATGGVREVTGLRVFTFFFPDEAALSARFTAHGYPAPVFRDGGGGRRVAMVPDPAAQWVELVVVPNAGPEILDAFEVGLTVSDLDKSRAFYRDFIGLEELAPIEDPLFGTTRHPYRHGTTTVNVWTFGRGLPANTRSAGIQYVVSDVEAVDARAKGYGVTIDTPLGNFSATLRTIWLADPDGITNYFAQVTRRPPASDTTGSR